MFPSTTLILVALGAYILGSLSFAIIVSRAMGLHDPRSYGSGNPGATNVLRSGNKKAAALTLLFDALKGWLPVFLLMQFGARWQLDPDSAALAGLAVLLGHIFPVFFGFKGGKGVATAAGVLFGFHPLLGLFVMLIWILVAAVTRYSSLAALIAGAAAPTIYMFGAQRGLWPSAGSPFMACMAMSVIMAWRHRENIQRLIAGKESRIGDKKR